MVGASPPSALRVPDGVSGEAPGRASRSSLGPRRPARGPRGLGEPLRSLTAPRGWCVEAAIKPQSQPQGRPLRSYRFPRASSSHTETPGSQAPANQAPGCQRRWGGGGGAVGERGPGRPAAYPVGGCTAPASSSCLEGQSLDANPSPGCGSAKGTCGAWPGQWSRAPSSACAHFVALKSTRRTSTVRENDPLPVSFLT